MLKVNSLYVSFTKEYYTLNDINFELNNNQKLTVIGGKESGRTVLLRVLLGLEPIAKGEVFYKDISLDKIDFQNDVNVGYLPVAPTFLEKKTVEDNIEYIVKLREKDKGYILNVASSAAFLPELPDPLLQDTRPGVPGWGHGRSPVPRLLCGGYRTPPYPHPSGLMPGMFQRNFLFRGCRPGGQ